MKHLIRSLLASYALFSASVVATEFTSEQLDTVTQIREASLASDLSWQLLSSLTTEVGPRLPGTENDKLAVEWAIKHFESLGFDKVWKEPAKFPNWRRYHESAQLIAPNTQPLHITALGNSISTPSRQSHHAPMDVRCKHMRACMCMREEAWRK